MALNLFDMISGTAPNGAGSASGSSGTSSFSDLFSDPQFLIGMQLLNNGMTKRVVGQGGGPLEGVPQMLLLANQLGDKSSSKAARLALAKQLGIDPALAADDTALKLAVDQANLKKTEDWQKGVLGTLNGSPGTSTPSAPKSAATAPGGFDTAVNRTLGFEGGYTSNDSNGAPANFGINQAANPDVSVKSLSKDQARDLYKTRYWDAIGGDQLAQQNPALAHVAFDAAVNSGPGRAKQWLEQSGGDPQKFLDIRQNFLQGLLQSNPDKYGPYAKSWASRLSGLRQDIGSGAQAPAQVASADPNFVPGTAANPNLKTPLGNNGLGISQLPNSQVVAADPAAFNPLSPTQSVDNGPLGTKVAQAAPAPAAADANAPRSRSQAMQEYNKIQTILMTAPSTMKESPFIKQLESQRDLLKETIKPTQDELNAMAAGRAPGTPEFSQFIEGNTDKTRTSYYNDWLKARKDGSFKGQYMDYVREVKSLENSKGEDEQSKKAGSLIGEALTKPVADLIGGVDPAQQKLVALNAMKEATKNPNLYTGAFGEQKQAFNKILQGVGKVFGIEPSEVDASAASAGETLEKFGRQLAGAQAKSVGGARVTNFELDQFIKANPGITMTPQGNERLIGIMQQMAKRELELGQQAQDYAAEKGPKANISEFRRQYISDYDKKNPVVDPITGKPLSSGTKIDDLDKGSSSERGDAAPAAAPAKVFTRSQYDQLKPGDTYIDPTGKLRTKGGN